MIFNPSKFCVYLIIIAEKQQFIHGASVFSLMTAYLWLAQILRSESLSFFMTSLVLGQILNSRGTLGTGQRFTPKKRSVPVICFESEIDRLVYNLYGLTEEEIKIVEGRE